MAEKWKSLTNADGSKGVRYREHATRKHGAIPDRYYVLTYWWQGKTRSEGIGWASEKIKPSKCFELLATIKSNQADGSGPCTLAEMRRLEAARKEAETREANRRATTLTDYFEQTFKPFSRLTKSPNTWSKEETHFYKWIQPILGNVPIWDIQLPHWDQLVQHLSAAVIGHKTKNKPEPREPRRLALRSKEYITGTLRRILKHAYERRFIDTPPPTSKRIGITGPKNNRRTRVITAAEREMILDALFARDVHAWRFTRFAFLTGCRASEIYKLRWGNVSFDFGIITLVRTKNSDDRRIPLSRPIRNLLEEIGPGEHDEYVFTNKRGMPYKESLKNFRIVVRELELNKGRAQRDRLVFHSIRHTVATNLAKTLNLSELQKLLGWRTVQMAARYIHGDDDAMRSALDGLGGNEKVQERKVLPFTERQTR